jgi:hypothetical protein
MQPQQEVVLEGVLRPKEGRLEVRCGLHRDGSVSGNHGCHEDSHLSDPLRPVHGNHHIPWLLGQARQKGFGQSPRFEALVPQQTVEAVQGALDLHAQVLRQPLSQVKRADDPGFDEDRHDQDQRLGLGPAKRLEKRPQTGITIE